MRARASFSVLHNSKRHHSRSISGFTIVELLIVLIVIAILAAMTIVAYNGVQQRANNASVVDAASKSLRMIQAYITTRSEYPYTSVNPTSWLCITISSGCAWSSGVPVSATFNSNMSTIGSLPLSVPVTGADRYGVIYYWKGSWVLSSGESRPVILIYWLQGTNQQCGLPGVITESGDTLIPSTNGYTVGSDNGKTRCEVSIPGPNG